MLNTSMHTLKMRQHKGDTKLVTYFGISDVYEVQLSSELVHLNPQLITRRIHLLVNMCMKKVHACLTKLDTKRFLKLFLRTAEWKKKVGYHSTSNN